MKLQMNFKQTRATLAGDINSPNFLVCFTFIHRLLYSLFVSDPLFIAVSRKYNFFFQACFSSPSFQRNTRIRQAVTKTGELRYAMSFPKAKKGEGIAREVKMIKCLVRNVSVNLNTGFDVNCWCLETDFCNSLSAHSCCYLFLRLLLKLYTWIVSHESDETMAFVDSLELELLALPSSLISYEKQIGFQMQKQHLELWKTWHFYFTITY